MFRRSTVHVLLAGSRQAATLSALHVQQHTTHMRSAIFPKPINTSYTRMNFDFIFPRVLISDIFAIQITNTYDTTRHNTTRSTSLFLSPSPTEHVPRCIWSCGTIKRPANMLKQSAQAVHYAPRTIADHVRSTPKMAIIRRNFRIRIAVPNTVSAIVSVKLEPIKNPFIATVRTISYPPVSHVK